MLNKVRMIIKRNASKCLKYFQAFNDVINIKKSDAGYGIYLISLITSCWSPHKCMLRNIAQMLKVNYLL